MSEKKEEKEIIAKNEAVESKTKENKTIIGFGGIEKYYSK